MRDSLMFQFCLAERIVLLLCFHHDVILELIDASSPRCEIECPICYVLIQVFLAFSLPVSMCRMLSMCTLKDMGRILGRLSLSL